MQQGCGVKRRGCVSTAFCRALFCFKTQAEAFVASRSRRVGCGHPSDRRLSGLFPFNLKSRRSIFGEIPSLSDTCRSRGIKLYIYSIVVPHQSLVTKAVDVNDLTPDRWKGPFPHQLLTSDCDMKWR